jgi:predicted permease
VNAVGRVATTGALALIGLFVVKLVFGMLGIVLGLTAFLLFKVLPIVLIVAFVIWIFKKVTRSGATA